MSNIATIAARGSIQNGNNSIKNIASRSGNVYAAEQQGEESKNNGGFAGGLGYLAEKTAVGFMSSIEGIWDYTAGGLASLFGGYSGQKWAEQQFANDWFGDWYSHPDEWYNPSDGWKIAGDVAGGIGTSLPAIAGVAAGAAIAYFSGGTLSAPAAGIISASIAGFGAAGNATKEAYRETGKLGAKEYGYGFLSGATEAAVEYLSAGIGAGTGRIVTAIASKTAKETGEAVVKTGAKTVIKNIVKDFASEAFEEGLSEILDPVYKRMTIDPNAKNASLQEVGYAALIGGLSGAIMSGGQIAISAGINTSANLISGSKAIQTGNADGVLNMARQLSETEAANNTGYDVFQQIKNTYDQLSASLAATNGEITTAKQKMQLGFLKRANTVAVFMPYVERSAMNILANPQSVADRYNAFGLKDANGNAITLTEDALLSGIDLTADRKTQIKQIRAALSTNSVLSTLAVTDAVGQLQLSTQRIAESALKGQQIANAADLNTLIEKGTPEQLAALSSELGIEDWGKVTIDEFRQKIADYAETGKMSDFLRQSERVRNAAGISPENAKPVPKRIRSNMQDGAYRLAGENGGMNAAIIKEGDEYHFYDYNSGNISRSLSVTEVNKILNSYWTRGEVAASDIKTEVEGRTNLATETLEIDAFAKENIKEYSKMSEPNKQAVRMTIRQARANGISEAETLVFAQTAARTGLNIVFDSGKLDLGNGRTAEGLSDRNTGTIYVSPKDGKIRTYDQILVHELDHFLTEEKGGKKLIERAIKNLPEADSEAIAELYFKRYVEMGEGDIAKIVSIINEEVSAKYAETIMKPEVMNYLLAEEPSFSQKILGLFSKAAQDYSFSPEMSKEARRFWRAYKKLFTELSERNQGNNALSLSAQTETKKAARTDGTRIALPDDITPYSEEETKSILRDSKNSVAESYNDVERFFKKSVAGNDQRRLFVGKLKTSVSKKILEKTGINTYNKGIVLTSDDIRHIVNNHGSEAGEALRGQTAITEDNFAQIIETLFSPDDVSLRADEKSGTKSILFEKSIDGEITAVTLVSEKKKALSLKSAWINKKTEQHISPPSDVQAPNLTPKSELSMNTVPMNSISQKTEKVKTKSEKISSISQIEQKYNNETKYLLLNEGKDTIKISNMVVKEENRGNGIGQKILSDIISYADSVGKTVTLTPTREFGTYERLKNWYKRNGFVENKGKNADQRISDTMYRSPKTVDNQQKIRYALTPVSPVQATSNEWNRTIDTEEAKKRFPTLWDISADESATRNPTQIRSTVSTYRKIYDILKSEGFNGTILDASSGLGYGTKAGIDEYGFKVDDIEPYPDRGYAPKYTDYSRLNKKYDAIISNAVLNVLPQDQRDALVVKMGELLNVGGQIFINVRGDDVNTLASNPDNVKIADMEWFVSSTGSYQKGFTKPELVAYLKDALGDGFKVESTSKFGKVSAIVAKTSDAKQSENIRFALSIGNETVTGQVEQTNNLVALHNLTEQNLLDSIKLGGFPAPSIAIVKADQGHSDYGAITVVFGKETIDPKISSYNNVFGLDAWTPTYPKIEYKPSEKVLNKIRNKYYDLAKRFGNEEARPLYNYVYDMERQLDNTRGENGLLQKIYDDPNIQNLYLQDMGKGKVADVYTETTTTMPKERVDYLRSFIDFIGEDAIRDLEVPSGETIFGHRKAYLNKYRDQIIQFVADHDYTNTPADQRVAQVKEDFKDIDLLRIAMDARKYLNEGDTKTTRDYDQSATEAAIKKVVDQKAYRAWVDDLFGGIEEKSGIRNSKDAYTSSGSRRSFEALHYENTLENVVKKMREDNLVGENTVFSGHGIWGVSAKKYGSISEIKADEGRLQKINEDDYKALKESFGERLNEIANSIADDRESNAFIALDNAMENIIDAIRTKKTKSGMLHYLQQYNPKATLQTVDDIVSLVSDIAEMPTGYFEAKPMRAVTFDEIKKVLLPADTSEKLIRTLKENNIPYEIYGNTDEERTAAVRKLDNVRFALPNTDSDGNVLSEQQMQYFKNSKIRDENGNLLKVYHGTSGDFAVFDKEKIRAVDTDADYNGFWFSDDPDTLPAWTKLNKRFEGYLNITNPAPLNVIKKVIRDARNGTVDYESARSINDVVRMRLQELGYDGIIHDDKPYVNREELERTGQTIVTTARGTKYLLRKEDGYIGEYRWHESDGGWFDEDEMITGYKDVDDYLSMQERVYVAFESNQFKEAKNRKPTPSPDVRYALPEVDSNGKALTEGQISYFANSKSVDKDGKLLVMYRGDPEEFFTFDRKKSKPSNLYGRGFYFSNSETHAAQYGKAKSYYLNIENPISTTKCTISRMDMRKFLNAVARNEDYSIENYGTTDIGEILSSVYGKSDFNMLYDVSLTAIGDMVEAVELFNKVAKTNYDGIILNTETVVFNSEQIKATSNENPTANPDVRYALDDDPFLDEVLEEPDVNGAEVMHGEQQYNPKSIVDRGAPRTPGRDNISRGEMKKTIANNTRQKVYSLKSTQAIVDRFSGISDLSKKTRAEIADSLWQGLNDCRDMDERLKFSHEMAEFIVAKLFTEPQVENPDIGMYRERLPYLESGISRIQFYPENRSELQHVLDKDGFRRLQGRWGYKGKKINSINGAKTSSVLMETFVTDIAREMPGMEYLEDMHPAEAFLEIDKMYSEAKDAIKNSKIPAYWDVPDSAVPGMVKSIEDMILQEFESGGEQSKYSKYVEGRIAEYQERAEYWKAEHDKLKGRNKLLGLLMSKAQRMKDLKLGTFLNASQFKNELFKASVERLANIQFRGNLNVTGTRKIMNDLRQWYVKENPILTDSYDEGIAGMLDELATGEKGFSKEDLTTMYNVMSYFTNLVENFNKVYRKGKWIEAKPEAERYISIINDNKNLKVGWFAKVAGTIYIQTFGDPMAVARRMDYYKSGFYTETMQELRDASVDAQIAEMELKSAYDAFMKRNKKYLSGAAKETVSYRGAAIPKMQAIGLYMTLKRQQAQAGLALNGFTFYDADGKKQRVNGFFFDPNPTEAELRSACLNEQKMLEGMFSGADKEYISILEKVYNEDARRLKADRDMQRLGFTNATSDYYYPIRRGNIAKNVDTSEAFAELDRVSSASFNKDTVKGAKQELYIESADTVFNRHVRAVCQYAYLSPAVEAYNRLFNLDISDNRNKPISVATESADVWSRGSKFIQKLLGRDGNNADRGNQYFKKLIADIQGIPASSSEGMALLGFVRGGYAKFQLSANPKVWVTQLSSLFAASSILDADSIVKGMTVSSEGLDKYCLLAKLRNNDNVVAKSQGLIESVGKLSEFMMKPIGATDRFVVSRLFGACQVQVEKNGGAKVGTDANKIEAGKLLRRIILETQQNAIATERSAAMRSGNEILRTVTMFTADSMKVVGRVIDSVGELSVLKARLKATADANVQAELNSQIKTARTKVRKSVAALMTSAVFMACVAQLFKWLYAKKRDEDESIAEDMIVDAVGNMMGGLPLIKDVYGRIAEGYDIDNYAYSSLNDLIDSTVSLFNTAGNMFSGDATKQDIFAGIKSLSYSAGQVFGFPTRNIYNVLYGLTKRISPEAAYKWDSNIYKKNLQSDLKKAVESGDDGMVETILSLALNERIGGGFSENAVKELSRITGSGYGVLPRSIASTVTIDGESVELTDEQKMYMRQSYADVYSAVENLIASKRYSAMADDKKADAINYVYDTYYEKALSEATGASAGKSILVSKIVGVENMAVLYAQTKGLKADTDKTGKTISGSKRNKVVAAINATALPKEKKLLLICANGYSLKDGDIAGVKAETAKKMLLRYILSLSGVSQAEKAEIAEMCGFEVRNGRIVAKSLLP